MDRFYKINCMTNQFSIFQKWKAICKRSNKTGSWQRFDQYRYFQSISTLTKYQSSVFSTNQYSRITETQWLNPKVFAAQIQIPIPNYYFGFGYQGQLMTHSTKMGADKYPQMPKNLSAQIVCPNPKVWDFDEKRLHWVVRSPCRYWYSIWKSYWILNVNTIFILYCSRLWFWVHSRVLQGVSYWNGRN